MPLPFPSAGPLPADVRRRLATAYFGRRAYFYPETDSTNDVALSLASAGEAEGTTVVADYQRRGRGRRAHTWSSPAGKDLLFSVILRPEGDARHALPVTLVTATAISVTLSKLLDVDVMVKWPNDVVTGSGKLAGILAESASSGGRLSHVVVGIGVNVNASEADFAGDLRGLAASCRTLSGVEWDRAELLADLLGTIEAYYDRFKRDGFGTLSSAYEARLAQANRVVSFERDGARWSGRVAGVSPDGALVVRLDDGRRTELFSEHVEVIA
ncbi:MAG TPA: biotin--[acetyl-CoA-carboxylase] ligase [Candidatus Krumholzibacteria bacterium]|nr:biotin--[acetyl-CoA-carboxylase] ligase [Candidatus Krumholzibacteria bacterium]